MKKKINIIIIIAFIITLGFYLGNNRSIKNDELLELKQYNKIVNESTKNNSRINVSKEKNYIKKVSGELIIPSINKRMVIFNGIDYNNLMKGACTIEKNKTIGSGNFVVCGHYMDNKDLLFGGVVDMKVGDEIIVKNKGVYHKFKVFKTIISNDERWDLVGDDALKKFGKKDYMITLMTCYYNEPGRRFFVFGEKE